MYEWTDKLTGKVQLVTVNINKLFDLCCRRFTWTEQVHMAYLSRICLKKLPGERWHFFRHKLKKSEEEGRVACKPQRTAEGKEKDG